MNTCADIGYHECPGCSTPWCPNHDIWTHEQKLKEHDCAIGKGFAYCDECGSSPYAENKISHFISTLQIKDTKVLQEEMLQIIDGPHAGKVTPRGTLRAGSVVRMPAGHEMVLYYCTTLGFDNQKQLILTIHDPTHKCL